MEEAGTGMGWDRRRWHEDEVADKRVGRDLSDAYEWDI